VAEAFRLARKADPEAELIYTDYGGEGLNRKSDAIYDLVKGLRQQGV
jgi:endo-1,4-beta-xylanase